MSGRQFPLMRQRKVRAPMVLLTPPSSSGESVVPFFDGLLVSLLKATTLAVVFGHSGKRLQSRGTLDVPHAARNERSVRCSQTSQGGVFHRWISAPSHGWQSFSSNPI